MNGAHDMGGRAGFGPVLAEQNEPVFHAEWERRIYGLNGALGACDLWNLDEDRHACENQRPDIYLASSYYEIWLHMLETMLLQKGIVTESELQSGRSSHGRVREPALKPEDVWQAQIAPASYHRSNRTKPKFAIGDRVRVRNLMKPTHTRLPGYLRGTIGEIVLIHGCHVFPDSNALLHGEDPQWLYAVRFTAEAIWGRAKHDFIHADLWEPYLERT
jgi:nitrile hydratase